MKKKLLFILFGVFTTFFQACNDTSVTPFENPPRDVVQQRLTATAWKLTEGGDLIGGISRFFEDGTFWIEDDNLEGGWDLSQDGKTVLLTLKGSGKRDSFAIISLTTTELTLRSGATPANWKTMKFAADPTFSKVKYLLSRHPWVFSSPGSLAGVKVIFTYHNSLIISKDGGTTVFPSDYTLENNETVLVTHQMLNTDKQEILQLTASELVLKDQNGTYILQPE